MLWNQVFCNLAIPEIRIKKIAEKDYYYKEEFRENSPIHELFGFE